MADSNESIIESCRPKGKWNDRRLKSIEPLERVRCLGEDDDGSEEMVVGGGDDEEEEVGYRLELDGVPNDELEEPVKLESSSDRGGGGGCGTEETNSWKEASRDSEGFDWLLVDGELDTCFNAEGKCFRRARTFSGESLDWVGVTLSLKSISLNTWVIVTRQWIDLSRRRNKKHSEEAIKKTTSIKVDIHVICNLLIIHICYSCFFVLPSMWIMDGLSFLKQLFAAHANEKQTRGRYWYYRYMEGREPHMASMGWYSERPLFRSLQTKSSICSGLYPSIVVRDQKLVLQTHP